MIVRIVKLTLQSDKTEDFLAFFAKHKKEITSFPGCLFLQGLRDINNNNIFFTYSHWKNETALNAYRDSDFFQSIWPQAKLWFAEKPEAWSNTPL